MKIAICGKSTTTSLPAKELARAGKKVLVIDWDAFTYGLHLFHCSQVLSV